MDKANKFGVRLRAIYYALKKKSKLQKKQLHYLVKN
ncbi:hypothetical protein [Trichodesmium erythraeum]